MRNAILPQTTALALSLGTVFTGSVLVEVIFRYPGLGNTLYQAIKLNDFFVIRGMIFIVIVTLGLATFIGYELILYYNISKIDDKKSFLFYFIQ